MHGTIVTPGHSAGTPSATHEPDAATVASLLADGAPLWLDLPGADGDAITMLRDSFAFHPLAVEDAEHFGQRPKIDAYPDFTLIVVYGLADDGSPIEVHCFYTGTHLVTVHREEFAAFSDVIERLTERTDGLPAPIMLLHRAIDTLIDTYFPVLDIMDDAIDQLQDAILRNPTNAQLGEIFRMKRRLVVIRRLAGEQRDMLATMGPDAAALPGMTIDADRYFRDLYDHLARISLKVDSFRDLLSSVLDMHVSTTSNRLNVVMKQLAIIATVFLPMSFITGFFGQNFEWMASRIGGAAVFWTAGVALQVAVAASLVVMFRRKGWIGRGAER